MLRINQLAGHLLEQNDNDVFIVSGKRTPVISFLGNLSNIKATELGALSDINLSTNLVDEVLMGNVCQSGLGQNPARQASLGAGIFTDNYFKGLSINTPCTTVNKVCSSSMKTVMIGAMSISNNYNKCVVAGGFESMSNVPFLLPKFRKGKVYGNDTVLDGLAFDGLTDVYNNIAMGLCAEKTAKDLNITRDMQDEYAINSYKKANLALKNLYFEKEITPIIQEDDEPKKFLPKKIPLLKPSFSKNGTITAANASKINDAGCALILMSNKLMKNLSLKPLAKIISYADAENEPIDFCIAPAKACELAIKRAAEKIPNFSINSIDYFEINEAFAVTVLANIKLLGIDEAKVNVNGGAISLGHPLGMSGARIILSLISVLNQNKGKYGLASLCNGGGGGSAIIIENMQI